MAQVVATRAIQSSIACPRAGSAHERSEKLKPSGFASRLLAREQRRSRRLVRQGGPIEAKRYVRAEPEVVPVTPEDEEKVCFRYYICCRGIGVKDCAVLNLELFSYVLIRRNR